MLHFFVHPQLQEFDFDEDEFWEEDDEDDVWEGPRTAHMKRQVVEK